MKKISPRSSSTPCSLVNSSQEKAPETSGLGASSSPSFVNPCTPSPATAGQPTGPCCDTASACALYSVPTGAVSSSFSQSSSLEAAMGKTAMRETATGEGAIPSPSYTNVSQDNFSHDEISQEGVFQDAPVHTGDSLGMNTASASESAQSKGRSPLAQGICKGIIFFATLAFIGGLLRYGDASGFFDASFLNAYVKDKGAGGIAIFMGLGVVFSAIGLPRQLMSVAAGYAFGVVWGTLIMGVSLVGGGLISFYYMRLFARSVLRRRFETKIAAIERVWLQKTFLLTLCWRLLPLGNNTLTNMLAGTSRVRPWPFFCGSFIGYIPQNLIFTLLGSGIGFDDTEKFLYSALLFFVSIALGIWVYWSLRKQGEEFVLITKGDAE